MASFTVLSAKRETKNARDKCKDVFFRDSLHAACFQGNSRSGQDLAQKNSLAFLRLPDDGATCLEFLELWENADAEMKQRYFPLEELLEPRLDAAGQTVHIPAKPISHLVKECAGNWDDPGSCWLDLNGKKDTPSTRANQELIFQALLRESQNPLLSRKAVVPTNRGQKQGIIEAIRIESKGKESQPYAYALYPNRIHKDIAEHLNSYRLMAGLEIGKLLEKVYSRLDRYLKSQGTKEEGADALEALSKPINFTNEELHYEDKLTQAVYLMRYLYAYAYEYKCMYREMIKREPHLPQTLSVTSIGCGNMVDYWALRAALNNCPDIRTTVDYTGVDIANWSSWLRICAADGDRAEFVQKNAVDYLRQQAAHGAASDVYIFPKSISEFDGRENVGGDDLNGIRNELRDVLHTSGKERVWLLISLPRSEYYRQNDEEKCTLLLESVQEAGYVTEDPKNCFTTTPDEPRKRIDEADPSFSYPKYIWDEWQSYIDAEPKNEADEKNKRKSEIRNPVLYTNHDKYQVLLFRRKE